jgi:hypothetical protein
MLRGIAAVGGLLSSNSLLDDNFLGGLVGGAQPANLTGSPL